MSVLKFDLTEQHIFLVKNIDLREYFSREIYEYDTIKDDIHEEFGIILYGMPEGDFDPLGSDGASYTDEQKAEMDKYFEEIPQALEIMQQIGQFEDGNYKTKFHDVNWKKVK